MEKSADLKEPTEITSKVDTSFQSSTNERLEPQRTSNNKNTSSHFEDDQAIHSSNVPSNVPLAHLTKEETCKPSNIIYNL